MKRAAAIADIFVVLTVAILASTLIGMVMTGTRAQPSVSPGPTPQRVTAAPIPTPTERSDPARSEDLPATVDATGASDVTADIQAFVDQAPDGTLIRLAAGGRYRVDGTISLVGRSDLVVDGRGATLFAAERGDDPERAVLRIRSSTRVVVRDLLIQGAHPEPGRYVPGFQWQHGVSIEGGHGIELDRLDIRGPMGDCVYITSDEHAWADGVWVRETGCRGNGRMGVAVVAGRNVRVEQSTFGVIGLSVLALEPEGTGVVPQGVENVAFIGNIVDGDFADKLLSAGGEGPIGNVVVEGTSVSGAAHGIWSLVATDGDLPTRDLVFRDNVADGAFVGREHAVLSFRRVDGLVVEGNRQRIDEASAAIRLVHVCNAIVQGNDLTPISRVLEEAGPCS